jgi:hypothetical protein
MRKDFGMAEAMLQGAGQVSDLDQILVELIAPDEFPREAVAAARQNREALIPRLLEAVKRVLADFDETGKTSDIAIAVLLLAEFRVKDALPLIWKILRLPENADEEMLGDAVDCFVPQILAEMIDSPDELDAASLDESIGAVQRATIMAAYLECVFDGRLTRTEALARQGELLRRMIENNDSAAIEWLLLSLMHLSPVELLDEIEKAYHSGVAHGEFVTLAEFQKVPQRGEDEFRDALEDIADRRKTPMLEQAERWYSGSLIQQFLEQSDYEEWPDEEYGESEDWLEDEEEFGRPMVVGAAPPVATIRYDQPRIGRNDPCPCGSGKKYKKCCGGR